MRGFKFKPSNARPFAVAFSRAILPTISFYSLQYCASSILMTLNLQITHFQLIFFLFVLHILCNHIIFVAIDILP